MAKSNQAIVTADETGEHNREKEGMQVERALAAYFSHSGIQKVIAHLTHDSAGGDLFQIEMLIPYPEDYKLCMELAKEEQQKNARLRLVRCASDMDRYDTIFYRGFHLMRNNANGGIHVFGGVEFFREKDYTVLRQWRKRIW